MSSSEILRALSFAAHAHREQVRKCSGEPYVNHLIEVAEILARVAEVTDVEVLSAAILHDVLEDTSVSEGELEKQFGVRVRELVQAVSDDKSLPQAERKRLQIEHMGGAGEDVRRIKLADHCSNIVAVPATWPATRQVEYLDWSERVAEACAGANPALEEEYRTRLRRSREMAAGDARRDVASLVRSPAALDPMRTRADAVSYLKKRGLHAAERDWALGKTVFVGAGHREYEGGVTGYRRAMYIVPKGNLWSSFELDHPRDGDGEAVSLADACERVAEILIPASE
jgi:GTP diphosphokinase / guanosine-3',5'-bis(diphosphate) 3'-diphosphatase